MALMSPLMVRGAGSAVIGGQEARHGLAAAGDRVAVLQAGDAADRAEPARAGAVRPRRADLAAAHMPALSVIVPPAGTLRSVFVHGPVARFPVWAASSVVPAAWHSSTSASYDAAPVDWAVLIRFPQIVHEPVNPVAARTSIALIVDPALPGGAPANMVLFEITDPLPLSATGLAVKSIAE